MRSAAARRSATCRSCSAASKARCAASRITTTGPTRCAARSWPTPRPIFCSTAMPSGRWSRWPTGSPTARRRREPRRHPRRRAVQARRAAKAGPRRTPTISTPPTRAPRIRRRQDRRSACPAFEQVEQDREAYARASRVLHRESNPGNARAAGPAPRRPRALGDAAADPADHAGDGRASTTCPTRARRIRPTARRKSPPGT